MWSQSEQLTFHLSHVTIDMDMMFGGKSFGYILHPRPNESFYLDINDLQSKSVSKKIVTVQCNAKETIAWNKNMNN